MRFEGAPVCLVGGERRRARRGAHWGYGLHFSSHCVYVGVVGVGGGAVEECDALPSHGFAAGPEFLGFGVAKKSSATLFEGEAAVAQAGGQGASCEPLTL